MKGDLQIDVDLGYPNSVESKYALEQNEFNFNIR